MLREVVRLLVREEMSRGNGPGLLRATVARSLQDREGIFKTLSVLAERERRIDQSQSEGLDEEARLAQLEEEVRAVRNRLHTRSSTLYSQRLEISFSRELALSNLRDTCSPQLHAFIDSMGVELERLRNVDPTNGVEHGVKNLFADNPKVPRYFLSNAPAIQRRALAVLAARSRAEELKLINRTEEELERELDELWLALPSIDGQLERVVAL